MATTAAPRGFRTMIMQLLGSISSQSVRGAVGKFSERSSGAGFNWVLGVGSWNKNGSERPASGHTSVSIHMSSCQTICTAF